MRKETGGSLQINWQKRSTVMRRDIDALKAGTVTPEKQGDSPTAYAKNAR